MDAHAQNTQVLLGTFPFFHQHGGSLVIDARHSNRANKQYNSAPASSTKASALPVVDNEMFVVLLREGDLRRRLGAEADIPVILRSFAHAIGGFAY